MDLRALVCGLVLLRVVVTVVVAVVLLVGIVVFYLRPPRCSPQLENVDVEGPGSRLARALMSSRVYDYSIALTTRVLLVIIRLIVLVLVLLFI